MVKPRKSFPLRISQELYDSLQKWADEELRSINSQIEFLLRESVQQRKKGKGRSTRSFHSTADRDSESGS